MTINPQGGFNEASLPSLQDDCFSNQGGDSLGFGAVHQGLCRAKPKHGTSSGKANSTGNLGGNILFLKK